MEKTKSKADFNIIKKMFNIEPSDWARYADGRLSFISPTGQKFVYSASDLEQVEKAAKRKAAAAEPPKKKAAISAERSTPASSSKAAKK